MSNVLKSNVGAPTTNFAYWQNPRIDTTYAPYNPVNAGTWVAKHFDAIQVFNDAGTDISNYINGGVVDYTNTYHAIWTYDSILGKPVVTMRNFDNQWKAKSWSSNTLTEMGLTYGSTYTISWLQWVDNISASANVGSYGPSTSAVNNFHDGLGGGQTTSKNTLTNTWQRVYATFTVSAVRNLTAWSATYMYGYDVSGATIKISDVQLEAGSIPSGFSKVLTRTSSKAILDMAKQNTLDVSNMVYSADKTFSFNGTSSFISGPSNIDYNSCTIIYVAKTTNLNSGVRNTSFSSYYGGTGPQFEFQGIDGTTGSLRSNFRDNTATTMASDATGGVGVLLVNTIYHIAVTYTNKTVSHYKNGVFLGSNLNSTQNSVNSNSPLTIGKNSTAGLYFNGTIYQVLIYDHALTTNEIAQNFNALRGRYGL
jgi:hypothetical protein